MTETALNPPSISDTVDSFESAALAIKISNRILLQAPISEQELWPEMLYRMPSTENSLKMALSGLGARHGVTVPTEFDKETGLPRPTSPFYIMIKDRNQMLDRELKQSYLNYFRSNSAAIECAIVNKLADCTNEFAYKNPLMAFGTVSGNTSELARLEQKIEQMSNGFRECDAWIRQSKEGEVAQAYCKDPALKDADFKGMEITKTREQLEQDHKVYGKLSKRVYQAAVGGADFTAAALTKIVSAIIKFPVALKNANNELKGWKGAINTAMILPRVKNISHSIGVYSSNLGLQLTAYKTMYTQINNSYPTDEQPASKAARLRVEQYEREFAVLRPRLEQLLAGQDVTFSAAETQRWELMAAAFPQPGAMEEFQLTAFSE
jgi:hypothetical protein